VTKPETISELIKHYSSNDPKDYAEGMLLFLDISIIYGF
jgi:hypothetical protein